MATQTWNPSHKATAVVLSNGNLTAMMSGANANSMVFAVNSVTSGKYYWEDVTTFTAGANRLGIGNTASATTAGVSLGTNADAIGYRSADGIVYQNNAGLATIATYATGSIICVALDMDNHKIWFRVGITGNWNNAAIGTQNPATNTGGIVIPAAVFASPVVPAAAVFSTTAPADSQVARFSSSAWTGTPPSGFGSMDVATVTSASATVNFNQISSVGLAKEENNTTANSTITFSAAGNATNVSTANNVSATISFVGGYARNSPATYFDASGILEYVSPNVIRIDHDRSTPFASRGLLLESAATNVVRNPRFEGATVGVIGSGGVAPTDAFALGPTSGVSITIVGTGADQGIPYIDLQFSGTAAAAVDMYFISEVAGTSTPAVAVGQTWTASNYIKLQAGSTTNVASVLLALVEWNSSTGYLSEHDLFLSPNTNSLASQFVSGSPTLGSASVDTLNHVLHVNVAGAGAVDVTLRLGGPQVELGSVATSLILPPVGAPGTTTRAADVAINSFISGGAQLDHSNSTNAVDSIFLVSASASAQQFDQANLAISIEVLSAAGAITQFDKSSATNTIEAISAVSSITQHNDSSSFDTIEVVTASGIASQFDTAHGTDSIEVLTASGSVSQFDLASSADTIEVISASGAASQFDFASSVDLIIVVSASGLAAQSNASTSIDALEVITAAARGVQEDLTSSTDTIEVLTALGVFRNAFPAASTDTIEVLTASGSVSQFDLASSSDTIEVLAAVASAGQENLAQAADTIEAIQVAATVMNPLAVSCVASIEVLSTVASVAQFDHWSSTNTVLAISANVHGVLGTVATSITNFFTISDVSTAKNPLAASAINSALLISAVGSLSNPDAASATNSVLVLSAIGALRNPNNAQATDSFFVISAAGTVQNPLPVSAINSIELLECAGTAQQVAVVSGAASIEVLQTVATLQVPLAASGDASWTTNAAGVLVQESLITGTGDVVFSGIGSFLPIEVRKADGLSTIMILSCEGQVKKFHLGLARQVWFDRDDRNVYWPPSIPVSSKQIGNYLIRA